LSPSGRVASILQIRHKATTPPAPQSCPDGALEHGKKLDSPRDEVKFSLSRMLLKPVLSGW
jgi:hypothetical protein